MPHPRDRLDVILVPADAEAQIDARAVEALFDRWQQEGLLAPGTGPLRRTGGPRAWALLPGGFQVAWLDRPVGIQLYANQLGGFRVPCPGCGGPLALAFGQAVERWRRGEDPTVRCGSCGHAAPAAQIPLRPEGAFARGALVLSDARGLEPSPAALRAVRAVLGEVRLILRRRS